MKASTRTSAAPKPVEAPVTQSSPKPPESERRVKAMHVVGVRSDVRDARAASRFIREIVSLRLPDELESLITTATPKDRDVIQAAQECLYGVRSSLLEVIGELTNIDDSLDGIDKEMVESVHADTAVDSLHVIAHEYDLREARAHHNGSIEEVEALMLDLQKLHGDACDTDSWEEGAVDIASKLRALRSSIYFAGTHYEGYVKAHPQTLESARATP